MPLVTVLLAVYNGAEVIDKALNSLLEQTFTQFTILCINDASTDATATILRSWQKRLGKDKLRLITNKHNLGLTKSLNRGLSTITTQYTARLDADDWWDKDKLSLQFSFMEKHPEYGVVGCYFINIVHGEKIKVRPPKADAEIRQTIVQSNPLAHSCVVFRTDLIKQLGGYNETIRYGQDYDLWFRCLPRTKFYNIPRFLCTRIVDKGISVTKMRQQMFQAVKTQLYYIRKYRLPMKSYVYTLEPLALILAPEWLKQLKRKLVD